MRLKLKTLYYLLFIMVAKSWLMLDYNSALLFMQRLCVLKFHSEILEENNCYRRPIGIRGI